MRAQVNEQCVIKANSLFWEQMLGMTLDPVSIAGESCVGAGHLLGSVNLAGEWKGRIEVRRAEGLAYHATAAMLMLAVDTVVEADVLDAAKEIANVIAGTIKSSLPRHCTMTVPESAVEAERFCLQSLTGNSLVVAFRHAAGNLLVHVWEQGCKP
jgi:CheY-specific phosphatase CheX